MMKKIIIAQAGDTMLAFFLAALESEDDKRKFVAVYEQYHEKMEMIALHILGSQHDSEDAVQNAFLQIIRHFEKIYEIPCEELPFWIISIVKNEALMILRKKRIESSLLYRYYVILYRTRWWASGIQRF